MRRFNTEAEQESARLETWRRGLLPALRSAKRDLESAEAAHAAARERLAQAEGENPGTPAASRAVVLALLFPPGPGGLGSDHSLRQVTASFLRACYSASAPGRSGASQRNTGLLSPERLQAPGLDFCLLALRWIVSR